MYGATVLGTALVRVAMSLADSSRRCDSAECSSSAMSCSRCLLSAGKAYAGLRGAKRPTNRMAMSLTSGFSSLSATNSARRLSAWPKCPSVTTDGLQKEASTALRTPESRSLTATARRRETMNSSTLALHPPDLGYAERRDAWVWVP